MLAAIADCGAAMSESCWNWIVDEPKVNHLIETCRLDWFSLRSCRKCDSEYSCRHLVDKCIESTSVGCWISNSSSALLIVTLLSDLLPPSQRSASSALQLRFFLSPSGLFLNTIFFEKRGLCCDGGCVSYCCKRMWSLKLYYSFFCRKDAVAHSWSFILASVWSYVFSEDLDGETSLYDTLEAI